MRNIPVNSRLSRTEATWVEYNAASVVFGAGQTDGTTPLLLGAVSVFPGEVKVIDLDFRSQRDDGTATQWKKISTVADNTYGTGILIDPNDVLNSDPQTTELITTVTTNGNFVEIYATGTLTNTFVVILKVEESYL